MQTLSRQRVQPTLSAARRRGSQPATSLSSLLRPARSRAAVPSGAGIRYLLIYACIARLLYRLPRAVYLATACSEEQRFGSRIVSFRGRARRAGALARRHRIPFRKCRRSRASKIRPGTHDSRRPWTPARSAGCSPLEHLSGWSGSFVAKADRSTGKRCKLALYVGTGARRISSSLLAVLQPNSIQWVGYSAEGDPLAELCSLTLAGRPLSVPGLPRKLDCSFRSQRTVTASPDSRGYARKGAENEDVI